MEGTLTLIIDFITKHYAEILGSLIGLVYLYYEYKASHNLWWAGIIMSLFYIYIFAASQCYAWAATYLYYLFANIYGFIAWRKSAHETQDGNIIVKNLTVKKWLNVGVATIIFTAGMYPILYYFTESTIPFFEAISTALSIVGTWLIAKKYRQHWILWIIVNAIYTIANIQIQLYPSAILFSVYTVVSFIGYIRWKKLEKNEL